MITLYLTRKVGTEPIPLSLPATPADIGNTFAELDTICPDPSATEIYKVDSEVRNLNRYICKADVEDSETLRKLNQLAELLQSMSREDQMKMEGVLDSNPINGMDDILNAPVDGSGCNEKYGLLGSAGGGDLESHPGELPC